MVGFGRGERIAIAADLVHDLRVGSCGTLAVVRVGAPLIRDERKENAQHDEAGFEQDRGEAETGFWHGEADVIPENAIL